MYIYIHKGVVAGDGAEVSAPQFSTRKVFQYVMELATMLAASASHSEQALKVFLIAAQVDTLHIYIYGQIHICIYT
jgi:hypothetical protein